MRLRIGKQHSFINVNTSSIKIFVSMTFFPPSATGTAQQHRNAICNCIYRFSYSYSLIRCVCLFAQQSFSIINNINMSSINIFVTMTSFFPPSATVTPHQQQQQQQQLQPERDSTIAMAIVTRRQQHSNCGTLEKERIHCWQWF